MTLKRFDTSEHQIRVKIDAFVPEIHLKVFSKLELTEALSLMQDNPEAKIHFTVDGSGFMEKPFLGSNETPAEILFRECVRRHLFEAAMTFIEMLNFKKAINLIFTEVEFDSIDLTDTLKLVFRLFKNFMEPRADR